MDLPIELFLSFIAFAVVMGIIGLWKRIPIMMFIAGAVITFWAITTDNIDMGSIPLTNSTVISETLVSNATVYHYNVENGNTNATTANVAGMNFGQSENLANVNSMLVGDVIQCIDIQLQRQGTPSGIITVGTYVADTPIQSFGTMLASSVSTTLTFYTFCVPEGSEAVGSAGTRFGFVVSGGNSTNYIVARYSTGNPFDGTNTLRTFLPFGTTSWSNAGTSAQDMVMRLYDFELGFQVIEDFNTTIVEDSYEFTEYPKILFGVIASVFMLAGALLWKYEEN